MTHLLSRIFRPVRWSLSKTAPAKEPVTLEDMKAHARIDDFDNEATVGGFIVAGREWVENHTHRALITQTFILKISSFPLVREAIIELMGGKVQSVTSIQYVDTSGATQTLATSEYVVDADWEPGRISLAFDKTWPAIREWGLPITITYVAGYGDDPADVPASLRSAIKIIASDLYENREDEIIGQTVSSVPWGAKVLASAYRVIRMV